MAEPREVRILIGKRHYTMQTELDNDELNGVVDIVNEVCGSISDPADQEDMLMLTCLHLAYNLKKISKVLEPVNKRLNDLKL